MKLSRGSYAVVVCSLAILGGCSSDPTPVAPEDVVSEFNALPDTVTDTPTDRGADTGPPPDNAQPIDVVSTDTQPDVLDESVADGGMDAAVDVTEDAAADVTSEPLADGGTDGAAPDVAVPDGGADVPADAAPTCPTPASTITLPSATPVVITGTTSGASVVASNRCQSNGSGPEVFYTVTITARTGVILSTDSAATTFDTTLSLRRDCANPASELSCDDDSGTTYGTASVLRAVLEPGTYSLIVDGYNGASGNFTLTASTFTPTANATCATPRDLTVGTALTAQSLDNAGGPGFCAPGLRPGGQVFYRVTLPASTLGTAVLTHATGSWTAALRAISDCSDVTCAANGTGSSSPVSLLIPNGGTAARTFILSAASNDAESTVTPFDIVVNTTPLAPGQACESATTLTPGTPLTGQSNMTAQIPNGPCRSETGGQLFYSVTIPAGQRVRVTATPTGTTPRQPVLRVLGACGATACLDDAIGGTSTTPAAASVDVPNAGTSARTVIVSLASSTPATAGTWDLSATLGTLVSGQFCAEPVTVAPGATLSAQDARSGIRASAACSTSNDGTQLFYRVSVPAGQRVVVRAVPAGAMAAWAPTLRALSSCTASSCVSNNTGTAGMPATVTLSNPGTAAQDFIVSVSGTAALSGTFNLEVGAGTVIPGYLGAAITAACDDLTAGTVLMTDEDDGLWDDDTSSAIAALPFSLPFFGDAVTRYSVNSNGMLVLLPAATGSASHEYSNTTIPTSDAPNGFVAALWDDLRTVTATGVRTATLGTAPSRRFVVQWTDFTLPSGDSAARLTFQVKLFETTNVVEVHYCAITAGNARASGNSATIGVEDSTGTLGTQTSYNTTGAAVTGAGVRYSPR